MGVHSSNRNWIPDSDAKACGACQKSFTLTTRKHHCRGCGKIFCSKCTPHRMSITLYGDACRVCVQCERRVRALGLLTKVEDGKEQEHSESSESSDSSASTLGGTTTVSLGPIPPSMPSTLTASPSVLKQPMTPQKGRPISTPHRSPGPKSPSGRPLPSQMAALRTLKFDDEKKTGDRVSQMPQAARDELLKQLTILRDCLLQSGDAEGAADVGGLEIRVRSKDPSLTLTDVKAIQIRVIDKILEGGELIDLIDPAVQTS